MQRCKIERKLKNVFDLISMLKLPYGTELFLICACGRYVRLVAELCGVVTCSLNSDQVLVQNICLLIYQP